MKYQMQVLLIGQDKQKRQITINFFVLLYNTLCTLEQLKVHKTNAILSFLFFGPS